MEIDLRNEIENAIDFLLFLKNQLNVKLKRETVMIGVTHTDTNEKINEFYFADWNFHNDLVDEYFMRKSCIIIVYKNGSKGYLGRIQFENGDLYEGEMEKNGKMNGNGIKTWNCNGEVIQKYEGDWEDGKSSFED
ncbi:hypothetical protein BpHYR1_042719, partial [Brachionus plicatilis]